MRYLLDTNIVPDLVRSPQGRAAESIRRVGEALVCTSIIVAAELRYGAAKRGSLRLARQLEAVLARLTCCPLPPPPTALTARSAPGSSSSVDRLAPTTYSLRLRHWLSAVRSSPTTRQSSLGSRGCFARIGCAERDKLNRVRTGSTMIGSSTSAPTVVILTMRPWCSSASRSVPCLTAS